MRLRLAGHPLHPALVHFPIGLWGAGVASELAGWFLGQPLWWTLAFAGQAAGCVMAVPAMLAGFLDLNAIPQGHRARDVAVGHMAAMASAWTLFALGAALRGWPPDAAPAPWVSLVALAGFAAVTLGGWLGGKLVYGFGVGVGVVAVEADRDATPPATDGPGAPADASAD